MTKNLRLSRRTVVRGLGAAVALPWLEAMSWGAESDQGKPPLRMGVVFVPNGINMAEWTPAEVGESFKLPSILAPLEPFKKDLLVLSGLAQDNAFAHGDGGGDHARSAATFLTGVHPYKTNGANIKAGVSLDQAAAGVVGRETRLASLEIGCEQGAQAGNCDSGYSCAYSSNISWKTPSTPMAKEVNPRMVFDRLFSGEDENESAENRAIRKRRQKSILDFVREDAQRLSGKLGRTDRRKLDEYFTGVRELERQIERVEKFSKSESVKLERPTGIPKNYRDHVRMMADLMVLAFQTDQTRVCTFMIANEGSNRSYPDLGVSDGHHEVSHHGKDKEKLEKIRKINLFHATQFAYLVERLSSVKEGSGTLLDHSMILYGSGIGDGDRHNHDDLPIVLAGKGAGSVKTGRHVVYPKRTPLNNLFLSMLDRMGVNLPTFGDSTGRLPQIS